jgi:hypothetical protein
VNIHEKVNILLGIPIVESNELLKYGEYAKPGAFNHAFAEPEYLMSALSDMSLGRGRGTSLSTGKPVYPNVIFFKSSFHISADPVFYFDKNKIEVSTVDGTIEDNHGTRMTHLEEICKDMFGDNYYRNRVLNGRYMREQEWYSRGPVKFNLSHIDNVRVEHSEIREFIIRFPDIKFTEYHH